jgi:hypothetical protein
MPRINIPAHDLDEIEDLEEQEDWEELIGLRGAHSRREAQQATVEARDQRRAARGSVEALARKRAERRKQFSRGKRA